MEERKTMSVEEVLRITAANLQGITIPVTASETIGATVCGCIRNLQLCIGAMEQERMQKEAAAATAEEKQTVEMHLDNGKVIEMEAEEDERDVDAE